MFRLLAAPRTPNASTVKQIQRLQATIGNQAVQRLIAQQTGSIAPKHEITPAPRHTFNNHTISRSYNDDTIQRDGEDPAPTAAAALGEGWVPFNKRGVVRDAGTGAYLRDQPLPGEESNIIATLPQNTRVLVLQHNPPPQSWFAIRVEEGEYAGQSGYVADWLIRHDLPDPDAVLYDIVLDDTLSGVMETQYAGYPITTGNDTRTLAMAIYIANPDNPGVELAGEADNSLGAELMDTVDTSGHRDAVREIFQTIHLNAGGTIWLPSVDYVNALRASNAIPQRSDEMNAAIDIGKSISGFTTGVVEGLVGSLIDLVMGVFDLARTVIDTIISVITGEMLKSAQELVAYLDELTDQEIQNLIGELLQVLVEAVVGTAERFVQQWNEDLLFERWNFRGRIAGYVLSELAMAWLTGGAANGVKLLDKMGAFGQRLRPIFNRVDEALRAMDDIPGFGRDRTPDAVDAEDVLPDGVPRSRGVDGDDVIPNEAIPDQRYHHEGDDDIQPEQLRVIMQARVLAETQDAMDIPVVAAVAALNAAFGSGNTRIGEFYSQPKAEPGTYRILLRTPIDEHFTNEPESDENSQTPENETGSTQPERSPHAELRASEGRGVGQALSDVTNARRADVFIQEDDGRWIVRGPNAREHIFSPDGGQIITTINNRTRNAHESLVRNGTRRAVTLTEFTDFERIFSGSRP